MERGGGTHRRYILRALGLLEAHLAGSYAVAVAGLIAVAVTGGFPVREPHQAILVLGSLFISAPVGMVLLLFESPVLLSGPARVPEGIALGVYVLMLLFVLRTRWRRWQDTPRDRMLCEKCKYNLTGNVSGVCPECGTKVDTA